MSFKEEVEISDSKLIITISCTMRKYSADPKLVYNKKVEDLIPEELRRKVTLISAPSLQISNTKYNNHTNWAQWIYTIKPASSSPQLEKLLTKKPRARTIRNKK